MSKNGGSDKDELEVEHTGNEELSRQDEIPGDDQVMMDQEAGEKGEGNECLSPSAVKGTEDDMGNHKVRGASMEVSMENTATPRKQIQIVEGHVYTPGFIRSLSGPESLRPNLNLEVVLEGPQDGIQENRPITDLSDLSDCAAHTQLRPLVHQEAKSRVVEQDNPARRGKPTQSVVNRCNKDGVEQSLNTRRRNKLLNEAQATMEVGKILGMDFQGKEKEVIGKLTELEQKDLARVEGKGVVLVELVVYGDEMMIWLLWLASWSMMAYTGLWSGLYLQGSMLFDSVDSVVLTQLSVRGVSICIFGMHPEFAEVAGSEEIDLEFALQRGLVL
ncbi:hypothetical protein LOK49_LG04G02365 [Camellia lanceoleosa]|uniref:Uncharacterized protein n=1 Tax=Camellia lanceoleosa TaxID=1840588 RepID=A0ACC0I609_9ERIC|nr:hypothetical protein LOK49_LG04G02365 [Camellia lanceoleosa]